MGNHCPHQEKREAYRQLPQIQCCGVGDLADTLFQSNGVQVGVSRCRVQAAAQRIGSAGAPPARPGRHGAGKQNPHPPPRRHPVKNARDLRKPLDALSANM